jgi:hypothetical protein
MNKIVLFGGITTLAGIASISFTQQKEIPTIQVEDGVSKELPMMNNNAFKRGELLTFKMHYGIIDAGVATLSYYRRSQRNCWTQNVSRSRFGFIKRNIRLVL